MKSMLESSSAYSGGLLGGCEPDQRIASFTNFMRRRLGALDGEEGDVRREENLIVIGL
jgi:hypothetical protein